MGVLESVMVGLIVAGCAIFSAWRLLSVRLRLKTLELLAGLPQYAGGRLVARLRSRTLAKMSGGCGACSGALNVSFPTPNRRSAGPRR
jgi:hypothetical protein